MSTTNTYMAPAAGQAYGTKPQPFASLARAYLNSLEAYREAKAAVRVASGIGHDTRDLEYHAASMHKRHQRALEVLLDRAVELRAEGAV